MNDVEPTDEHPRPPPNLMRYVIWFMVGEDGLVAFEEGFESGVERWGYWWTIPWGVKQCLKAVGWAFWAAVAKFLGLF